jgi:predicted restriction endonuclease
VHFLINLPVASGILIDEVISHRKLAKSIGQASHIRLSPEESESAHRLLHEKANPSPTREFERAPSDIAAPPDRIEARVRRIIRDTVAAKSLKAIYDYNCQVCGLRIEPAPGKYYVEVHHVRPLGGDHHGLDTHGNMLVLCPNHHAMFDFGIPHFIDADHIMIRETAHAMRCKHTLTDDVIAYHNEHIHRPAV